MGRLSRVLAAFMLMSGVVLAQDLPQHAIRTAAPMSPSAAMFIPGESVEPLILAEWEVINDLGPRIRIVWGQEAVDAAPPEASRYIQKSYVFPTGTIRVLDFQKDEGGMMHAITVETAIYMLKGSGTVEVAGETVTLNEGDLASYPSGTLRGDGDSTVIAWTVTGSKINEVAEAMVVRGIDVPVTHSAQWPGPDGKMVRARTSEALWEAPGDAIRLDLKRYMFDGNSVRTTINYKGGPTSKVTSSMDALIYITSGKLHFFQDDLNFVAGAGDAIREISGHYHNWIRLEDSSFIATSSLPVAPIMEGAN
ncbi:MAG: cupin domain-containing protein [Rhodospirillales bacterium]